MVCKCILYMSKAVSTLYGGIAQLGECLTGSQKVTGSSPVISTTFFIQQYLQRICFVRLCNNKIVTILTPLSLEKKYVFMV